MAEEQAETANTHQDPAADAPPPPFHADDDHHDNDSAAPHPSLQTSEALPGYEPSSKAQSQPRRRTVVERVFTLDTSKGKPWAFLKVNSRNSSSSQNAPSFFEGDLVTGTVELELEKPDSFVAIILEVAQYYYSLKLSLPLRLIIH